jgi:glycosyltransferase involved in cell wall biosynthesis
VNLIGEVDDVRPYVWNADVVIAPLTIARGIQNKVLEAMAMAKPIIATPQAIEGTGAIAGEHLLSPTETAEWPGLLAELASHPERLSTLSNAARGYVAGQHDWESQLKSLSTLLGLDGMEESEMSPVRQENARPSVLTSSR